MSTRVQVEAEAAELYPIDWVLHSNNFIKEQELCRRAHVRAKTVSPERLYAAARVMHNMTVDTPWGECSSEVQADLEVQSAAFRAAGFIIEGDEQ